MTSRLNNTAIILSLVLIAFALTGCDKTISLRFYNHTDDSVDIELDGPHYDDADIGTIPPYGYYRFDMKVNDHHFPAQYELEADEDVDFTVNKHTPGTLYIDILDDKVIGPNRRPIRSCGCRGCRRR